MERYDGPKLELPGVHPSPNIQGAPDTYEIENEAVDPDRRIEAAMWQIAPWRNKVVLDLGSGTGYHLQRFHVLAAHVIGVEPHGPSHLRAAERIASLGLERASIIRGSAEAIPLPDRSVDVAHCRFAYFAGPGSEPGLAELERVVRPGGTVCIIENDLNGGQFASWLRASQYAERIDPDMTAAFYGDHGFTVESIESEWQFRSREDLESVVRIEFPSDLAEHIIDCHEGTRVSYHYLLIHRTY